MPFADDRGDEIPNRTFAAYFIANHDIARPITKNANTRSNCGAGIILLARDCMATPELSGFPRRGIIFLMDMGSVKSRKKKSAADRLARPAQPGG